MVGAAAAQTSKAPAKEKEEAKIEGAVQIAIGVKKEVDFAAWYTNVIVIRVFSGHGTDNVGRSFSKRTCSIITASVGATS